MSSQHGEREVADLLGACLRAGEVPRPERIAVGLHTTSAAPSDVALCGAGGRQTPVPYRDPTPGAVALTPP